MSSKSNRVAIVAAWRTPVGSFGGALANHSAAQLGALVIGHALESSGDIRTRIDDVIFGHVLQGGCGQNTARQAALLAGIAKETPAVTVNQVCGSGLRAVALGAMSISAGNSQVVIAGGHESMSNAPHFVSVRSKRQRLGDARMRDLLLCDGLIDTLGGYHMGQTAENVAKRFAISREEQDSYAYQSQQKAAAAIASGAFDAEIVPVPTKHEEMRRDEYVRGQTTMDLLAKLKPAFCDDGTVTAGNASGINDGAAVLVLFSEAMVRSAGIEPLVWIRDCASVGCDPAVMGLGPIAASRACLARTGWGIDDLDLIEINEAFAAQSIAVHREMGWDTDKCNVNGGAIAIGHPIGASGARILVTLIHAMRARDAKRGLATLCIGGGMGIALTCERD